MKRRIPSMARAVKRNKLTRFKFPQTVLIFGLVAFATFIMGGGIYDLLEKPYSVLPGPGGGWMTVHPLINEQTLNESLLSMSFYTFIFAGFFLSYRSSQIRYNPRQFKMMLTIGIVMLILGVIGCNYLVFLKSTLG